MSEFVRVPKEPTLEMLLAANRAWQIPDPSPFDKGDEARRVVYRAMLAAAPSPEVRTGGEGPEPLTEEERRLLLRFARARRKPNDTNAEIADAIEHVMRFHDHYRNQRNSPCELRTNCSAIDRAQGKE